MADKSLRPACLSASVKKFIARPRAKRARSTTNKLLLFSYLHEFQENYEWIGSHVSSFFQPFTRIPPKTNQRENKIGKSSSENDCYVGSLGNGSQVLWLTDITTVDTLDDLK